MPITMQMLSQQVDLEGTRAMVLGQLQAALAEPVSTLRFLGRYTSWNGYFGSGVAALAGKVGRNRGLFLDPAEPILAVADRSVLVASYFFDAARDEFDDRDTAHRDTHRCLAQAMLAGLVRCFAGQSEHSEHFSNPAWVNSVLRPPLWLEALQERVAIGYGARSPDDAASIFRAMGYHLGSEVLADQEFSLIDRTLSTQAPALVESLAATRVEIAGQAHSAWQWIRIHSGHGGGAEAEHFEWAVQGVRLAFSFAPAGHREELVRQVLLGFSDFARDHREFFSQAVPSSS
jgi:hypothetical protein